MTRRLLAALLAFVLVFVTIAPVYAADIYDFTLDLSGGSEYESGDYLTVTGTVTKNGNVYPGVPVSIKIDAKSRDARMHSGRIDANAQGQFTFEFMEGNELR